jgi:cysteine-rich repeat protein
MTVRTCVAVAVALLVAGGCTLATQGLAPEDTALDDAGNPIADGATADVVVDDADTNDSSPLFPVDDGGSIPECTGKANGTLCGPAAPRSICIDGECIPSRCGDGIVDPPNEDCDDKNTDDGDNCPGD